MPDTVVRDGWAIGVAAYPNPFPPGSVGALHSEACVVVTGRTAQDVERLLREPTDEDIARAARALWDAEGMRMYHGSFDRADGYLRRKYLAIARAAIAAYRSPEEADHA